MTTDIELAQSLKRRATSANEFGESLYVKADDILALVEALEKAQQTEKTLESRNRRLDGIITAAEKRIAELESRTVKLPLPSCTYADHSYPAYSKRQVISLLESLGIIVFEGDV
ncbi:TPA: hypothetical protein MD270_000988 [Klebsiella pneumoniae]|nr:hypothetical protein [Klebsiella pneumoniae]HCB9371758.1 hypothetical protein [Klebsiella pneumoniae]HCU1235456.1 hypothetical protein [Klebsiella pneumoniae]HDK6455146.1 hypothetical protein [Klebsiella pneumoniae]